MGCMRKISSGSSYQNNDKNPNPNKFIIKQVWNSGKYWLCLINYPGCVNFEGNKILVTNYDPGIYRYIDPHFTENGGILARFQPTQIGWNHGQKFIKMLNGN